jgi:hypothetical protein
MWITALDGEAEFIFVIGSPAVQRPIHHWRALRPASGYKIVQRTGKTSRLFRT